MQTRTRESESSGKVPQRRASKWARPIAKWMARDPQYRLTISASSIFLSRCCLLILSFSLPFSSLSHNFIFSHSLFLSLSLILSLTLSFSRPLASHSQHLFSALLCSFPPFKTRCEFLRESRFSHRQSVGHSAICDHPAFVSTHTKIKVRERQAQPLTTMFKISFGRNRPSTSTRHPATRAILQSETTSSQSTLLPSKRTRMLLRPRHQPPHLLSSVQTRHPILQWPSRPSL